MEIVSVLFPMGVNLLLAVQVPERVLIFLIMIQDQKYLLSQSMTHVVKLLQALMANGVEKVRIEEVDGLPIS
uniref:Putative secreted protein n=1 Tax=Panstrongylus lignarius TaxID=156445 RepID=A0A224Y4R6_9HEMI